MKTKNTAALVNAFNTYKNTFNAAMRFIFDKAKETPATIPATPAKDDKSTEACELRKAIKAAEKNNAAIAAAISICTRFNVQGVTSRELTEIRAKVMENVPALDVNGNSVKFAKLPTYLKNDIANYNEVFAVAPATWIETISAAAENVEGTQKTDYELTIAPAVENGEVVENAAGNIVDANGEKVNTSTIFATWDKLASYKNIANAAGRETSSRTFAELMQA